MPKSYIYYRPALAVPQSYLEVVLRQVLGAAPLGIPLSYIGLLAVLATVGVGAQVDLGAFNGDRPETDSDQENDETDDDRPAHADSHSTGVIYARVRSRKQA